MIQFPEPAIVRDLPRAEIVARGLGLKWWGEFYQPMTCVVDGAKIIIPRGFMTDGASVPRIAWALLDATDPDILYPSYLHDFLYSRRGILGSVEFTRFECDYVLRQGMLSVGASRYKASAVQLAVNLFGQEAWRNQPTAKSLSAIGGPSRTGAYDKEME